MALFKNKWEIKTWADLSASVADPSSSLVFRPVHRLPYALQQGPKASKKSGGFFNRDSVLKSPEFPAGYYIYDTGSGASYTPFPRTEFKADMTEFLNSSSLSATAKSNISTSFNNTSFPAIIVQCDTSSFTGSLTGSGPCTASWEVPVAFIGDGQTNLLTTVNRSTFATNIQLQAGGSSIAGNTKNVEFTLPMETMSFAGSFPSRSIAFHSFTGSEYSSETYESSSIWTPHGGTPTTASVIGTNFGSGSYTPQANYPDFVTHTGFIKALGDGNDDIYTFGDKVNILHFATESVVASHSYDRYAITDLLRSGATSSGIVYFVSGSQSTAPFNFWIGSGSLGQSGSHLFGDATLATPADPGLYLFSGSSYVYAAPLDSSKGDRTPRFNASTY